MKKQTVARRLLSVLLCMPLLSTVVASAEEVLASADLGRYASLGEQVALVQGLELQSVTTFAWGGMPLLDQESNGALTSLLGTTKLTARQQGGGGSGYRAYALLLRDVPVVDLVSMAVGDVYYEQSNLLGGRTVAVTRQEFSQLTRRFSERSGGAMPQNLDLLFETVVATLAGLQDTSVEMETLSGVLDILATWQEQALTTETRPRPETAIPGIYGSRAQVVRITRDDAIELARSLGELLLSDEMYWEEATRAQIGEDEARVKETTAQITALLETFPDVLALTLPQNMEPAELRDILGLNGAVVSRQFEMNIPGVVSVFVEWVPQPYGLPTSLVSVTSGDASLTLMLSQQSDAPTQTGNVQRARTRTVAELSVREADVRVDIMITQIQNIERRPEKEIVYTRTEWIAQSDALFGEDAVVTLLISETDTASGEGSTYARKREASCFLKGLGFDTRKVLTVSTATKAVNADIPYNPEEDIIRPAMLDDEAFDQWLDDTRVSLMQAWYTIIGRLPRDVAKYMLERWEGF